MHDFTFFHSSCLSFLLPPTFLWWLYDGLSLVYLEHSIFYFFSGGGVLFWPLKVCMPHPWIKWNQSYFSKTWACKTCKHILKMKFCYAFNNPNPTESVAFFTTWVGHIWFAPRLPMYAPLSSQNGIDYTFGNLSKWRYEIHGTHLPDLIPTRSGLKSDSSRRSSWCKGVDGQVFYFSTQ